MVYFIVYDKVNTNIKKEFRPLKELTEHLTTRADDSHAAPVKQYCEFEFKL